MQKKLDQRAAGAWTTRLDTIQDFLCKLDMKPNMHLLEISTFSLYHVIVRPTKISAEVKKIVHIFRKESIIKNQKFQKKIINK